MMTDMLKHLPAVEAMTSLQSLVDRYPGRAVIIGGVAENLLGNSLQFSATMDALVTISIEELGKLILASNEEGFQVRIDDPHTYARSNRMLLLRHTETDTDLDIKIGEIPVLEALIRRSKMVSVGPLQLRIPDIEDLIMVIHLRHKKS